MEGPGYRDVVVVKDAEDGLWERVDVCEIEGNLWNFERDWSEDWFSVK